MVPSDDSLGDLNELSEIADVRFISYTTHGLHTVGYCLHDFVGVCDGRVGYVLVIELYCVGETLASCCFHMAQLGSIMFR